MQAIAEITEVIGQLSGYRATIVAAVEQQTATSGEITRVVAAASGRTDQIAAGVSAVAAAATTTADGAAQARTAADELARMSTHLHTLVARLRH